MFDGPFPEMDGAGQGIREATWRTRTSSREHDAGILHELLSTDRDMVALLAGESSLSVCRDKQGMEHSAVQPILPADVSKRAT